MFRAYACSTRCCGAVALRWWRVLCLSRVELLVWRQSVQQVSPRFGLSCKTLSCFVFVWVWELNFLHGIGSEIITCVTSCNGTLDLIVMSGVSLVLDRDATVNVFPLQPVEYSSYRGSRTSSRAGSACTSPVVSPPPQTPSHQLHRINVVFKITLVSSHVSSHRG